MAPSLGLACATAAFLLALSACGPSPNKQTASGSPSSVQPTSSSGATTAPIQSPSPAGAVSPPAPTTAPASANEEAVDLGSVTIESEEGANKGAPVEVDLVFVYDATLIPQIESESAGAWFKNKAALTAGPASGNLAVMSWTISPGDEVPETPVDARSGALAAFVFANYAAKGDHRLRIDGSGELTVTLEASDPTFEVEQ